MCLCEFYWILHIKHVNREIIVQTNWQIRKTENWVVSYSVSKTTFFFLFENVTGYIHTYYILVKQCLQTFFHGLLHHIQFF